MGYEDFAYIVEILVTGVLLVEWNKVEIPIHVSTNIRLYAFIKVLNILWNTSVYFFRSIFPVHGHTFLLNLLSSYVASRSPWFSWGCWAPFISFPAYRGITAMLVYIIQHLYYICHFPITILRSFIYVSLCLALCNTYWRSCFCYTVWRKNSLLSITQSLAFPHRLFGMHINKTIVEYS